MEGTTFLTKKILNAPTIANLFMDELETKIIAECPGKFGLLYHVIFRGKKIPNNFLIVLRMNIKLLRS